MLHGDQCRHRHQRSGRLQQLEILSAWLADEGRPAAAGGLEGLVQLSEPFTHPHRHRTNRVGREEVGVLMKDHTVGIRVLLGVHGDVIGVFHADEVTGNGHRSALEFGLERCERLVVLENDNHGPHRRDIQIIGEHAADDVAKLFEAPRDVSNVPFGCVTNEDEMLGGQARPSGQRSSRTRENADPEQQRDGNSFHGHGPSA